MRKTKSFISINIKGRDWEFHLVPDKTFDKIHNPNGELNTAMTNANQYKVDFRRADWSIVDIRHELGHVLKHMSHTSSVDLSSGDTEELMCELYASNFTEVAMWTDKIAEVFFGRE